MRYTIKFHQANPADVQAKDGAVIFNGAALAPWEAAMLSDALAQCAEAATDQQEAAVANLRPVVL